MAAEKKKKKNFKLTAETADIHVLYEAAVQCPEANLTFAQRVFEVTRRREPLFLREDFCGTANLACEWVAMDSDHESWGVDLDLDTLKWGEDRHLDRIGEAADRVHLINDDVMIAETPPVDITVAFNFSYWIFKRRSELIGYFQQVYQGLNNVGLLVVDIFGGNRATAEGSEKQYVTHKVDAAGKKIPRFAYEWEQARFNPITHELLCHMHFEFSDKSRIEKAFTYDWRIWSIPEVRECMLEAGFSSVDVYTHGWQEDGESDDTYLKVEDFPNEDAWLGYIVAVK